MSRINSAEQAALDEGDRASADTSTSLSEASDSRLAGPAPQPTASPAIYTAALSKHFGATIAVDSLSMTVQRG